MGRKQDSYEDDDFTPKTPPSHTQSSCRDTSNKKGSQNDSPGVEMKNYTNGNMKELIKDDREALKREKAEFMY